MGRAQMTPFDPPFANDGFDHDPLTDLIGMGSALSRIAAWQARAARHNEQAPIHAMLLCFERFSALNLAFGRAVGDRALVAAAGQMLNFAREELGSQWLVARITGNTFLIAVNEPMSRKRWQWLAEELSCALAQPIEMPGEASPAHQIRLRQRTALSRSTPGEEPQRVLTRLAEALETSSPPMGGMPVWVDGAVSPPGRGAAQLEADLLAALEGDEIEILYQPQFASDSGAIVGAEALARWRHPQIGPIGAVGLFAIAERSGLGAPLSRRIVRAALDEAHTWPGHLRLSLNVTAADLADRNFANRLRSTLDVTRFSPHRLTLEITEQELVRDLESSARILRALTGLGIAIALDDFGAGFCNFRYLKVLPLKYLKLDRCMVDDIATDPRDLAVLRGIVAMAQALGLEVVAEGIEHDAQRQVVAREGCSSWQGFLGSEPISSARFRALAAGS